MDSIHPEALEFASILTFAFCCIGMLIVTSGISKLDHIHYTIKITIFWTLLAIAFAALIVSLKTSTSFDEGAYVTERTSFQERCEANGGRVLYIGGKGECFRKDLFVTVEPEK